MIVNLEDISFTEEPSTVLKQAIKDYISSPNPDSPFPRGHDYYITQAESQSYLANRFVGQESQAF